MKMDAFHPPPVCVEGILRQGPGPRAANFCEKVVRAIARGRRLLSVVLGPDYLHVARSGMLQCNGMCVIDAYSRRDTVARRAIS